MVKTKVRRAARAADIPVDDPELFERLREVRKTLADDEECPDKNDRGIREPGQRFDRAHQSGEEEA